MASEFPRESSPVESESSRQVVGFLSEAREAEQSEQLPLAVELLERAHVLDPGHIPCRMHLASISNRIGRIERAMELYRALLPEVPDDSVLLNNIASVFFDLGCVEKSFELYRLSTERNPSNYLPHANLAYLYALTGEKEAALDYAGRLQQLVPRSRYQPFTKVAACRAYWANDRREEAARFLDHATIDDKLNLVFNIQRLLLAKELGIEYEIGDIVTRNVHRAKEYLQRGISPHKVYYRLTLFHLFGGSHRLAMQTAKSAVAEGPYKGIARYAGLYYLDQMGVPEDDKIRRLWARSEASFPVPPYAW